MMKASHLFEIEMTMNYLLLRLYGCIDAATVEKIRPSIEDALPDECGNIIVDLKDVEFLDSHGVGLFVRLLKKANANGGKLIFSGAGGQPAAVLQMVGFNSELVTYCSTRNDAFERLAP